MITVAPPAFWWLSPLVVSLGIAGSMGIAFFTITTNRRIARIKATLDLIEASESRDHYVSLYRLYRRFRTDPDFRNSVLRPVNEDDKLARMRCFDLLNHCELVGIGFKEGILDKKIL